MAVIAVTTTIATSGAGTAVVNARQHQHDQHGDREQRIDQPRHAEQVRHLRHEDQDAEGVHEADHHRPGNEPHDAGKAGDAEEDLNEPGQQHRGQQVLHTVLAHQRRHDQRHRAGRGGDHRRTSAQNRHRNREHHGCHETHARVDAGDHRERDDLGNQGEGRDDAGEYLGA